MSSLKKITFFLTSFVLGCLCIWFLSDLSVLGLSMLWTVVCSVLAFIFLNYSLSRKLSSSLFTTLNLFPFIPFLTFIAEYNQYTLVTALFIWLGLNYFHFYRPTLSLYINKRILSFIPSLLLVSFAAFYISQQSPNDPVDRIMASFDGNNGIQKNGADLEGREQIRRELGLDKPLFYLNIGTLADCDTLHKIKNKVHRENLHRLTRKYGNWDDIAHYYVSIQQALSHLSRLQADSIFTANSDYASEEITLDTNCLFLYNQHQYIISDSSRLNTLTALGDTAWFEFNTDTIVEHEELNQHSFDYLLNNSQFKADQAYFSNKTETFEIGTLWYSKDSTLRDFSYRPDSSIVGEWTKEAIQNQINNSVNAYNIVLSSSHDKVISNQLGLLDTTLQQYAFLDAQHKHYSTVQSNYTSMMNESTTWKNYFPSLTWNGAGNRYHQWLFGTKPWFNEGTGSEGVLRGDFGINFSGQAVNTEIWKKFRLSFELVFLSILIAYLISLPIGIWSAYKRNSLFDRGVGLVLFILYSLPNFFIGLLLINWFANPDHFEWFYSSGFRPDDILDKQYYEEMSYFERLKMSWPYMILPLVTYTYATFAFISRIMRAGMLENLEQDYVRTARAKGLPESVVIFKHALKNSLLPIITLFANVFPLSIGGSVIVEMIFDYEGMGKTSLDAILQGDYPTIIAIFCIAGVLTMIGYLVSDILYAIVDPRISLSKKK